MRVTVASGLAAGMGVVMIWSSVAAQPPTAQPQAAPPQPSVRSELPLSENPGNRQKVTLDGCLSREVGTGNDGDRFVLRSAQLMPQDADGGTAAAGTPTEAVVATSGTTPASSASVSPHTGAGAAVPDLKAYRLQGAREGGIAAWVGQRVTIVGLLDAGAHQGEAAVTIAPWTDAASPGAPSTDAEPVEVRIDGAVTILSLMPAEKACTTADLR